jgi:YD repeat-containing protein
LAVPASAQTHIVEFSLDSSSVVGFSQQTVTMHIVVTGGSVQLVHQNGGGGSTGICNFPSGSLSSGNYVATCSFTSQAVTNTYVATTYDGLESRSVSLNVVPNTISLSVTPRGLVTDRWSSPQATLTGKLLAKLPTNQGRIFHYTADGPLCCGGNINFDSGIDTGSVNFWVGGTVTQPTDVHFVPVEPGTGTTMTLYPNDDGKDPDMGRCAECEAKAGSPINITNGNTYITASDVSYPGLGGGQNLSRTWNSKHPSADFALGWFGRSWMSTFDERLTFPQTNQVRYYRPDGSSVFFTYDTLNGVYRLSGPLDAQLSLIYDSSTSSYSVWSIDNSRSTFNTNGKLTATIDRNGNATTIQYLANGRIQTVTDPAGRKLTATYGNPTYAVITSITSDAGQTWT